ncbi:MAG: hypothetical protein AVDCRST_MAG50-2538 [uncultured Acidimicrobiales bacterium]|uniref:Uncharacterized protein n=1 Tax=uncultured Acidimicrobiales bacterium TaxID=310071 RepID=A0A6J4IDU6_9ACTN|nr:MAG: hypothetical protein AVDCRST_MAG50-2538 [uncultured Acidimicrobiales bacterium]
MPSRQRCTGMPPFRRTGVSRGPDAQHGVDGGPRRVADAPKRDAPKG